MRLINHSYSTDEALEAFIESHSLAAYESVLIQLFVSDCEIPVAYRVRNTLKAKLPSASIIATTTAGIVAGEQIADGKIILSFSVFDKSSVVSSGYSGKSPDEIIKALDAQTLIAADTRLLVVFVNTFRCDASALLRKISESYPHVIVAGGNAGDNFRFQQCEVFTAGVDDCDVAVASVRSSSLQVTVQYLLNWQSIGQEMYITKSEGSEVFEINGRRALDVYAHYLGTEVAGNILEHGIEFPLIFKISGVEIARAPVAVNQESGSIVFAGDFPQGVGVRFGYANVDDVVRKNKEILARDFIYRNEAVYVYSCSARRQMLGSYFNEELTCLNQIGPSAGFITYGEFFHDGARCRNNLLNITTTFVVLNESTPVRKVDYVACFDEKDKKEVTFKALTTLIAKTSEDLEENIHYLEQFKQAVSTSSIFSITDERGVITEVNDNFVDISGYTRDELIGRPHNIVRSKEMPKETFKEMWKTIQAGNLWKGLVKNRRKDGKHYYVITQIMPIYYKDGTFREYIGIRNDVTELEEYKNFLKHELDTTSKNFEESLHYIEQYEKAINSTTAILKTDTDNMIKYANDKFCEISGYSHNELIGTNCEEMRHEKHRVAGICKQIREKLAARESVYETLTNIAKDGSEYVVYSLFYPVLDQSGNVIEHLQVMHDITQIVHLNEEIVSTQKEVVMTMGAIGETRSKETGLHVKRVAEYSYLLARLYGLDESEATLLKQASPMHDIGKVGIPDNVLNKPGKLTDEEYEIMKTHAQLGYEMLKHSERPILKASAIIAYTHHEKYDGSGYPCALAGENIPIFGRITALADVFDALGHDRVYKKRWEDERIFTLFREERGKHFDPVLIDLFFAHLDEFLAIREMYEDRIEMNT